MRLKSRFLACAVLTVVLAMLANATLAYYTDRVETHNVVTSGGIRITLDEKTDTGADFVNVDNVMPGDVISKIVTVTNEEQPAWIRVWVELEGEMHIGKELAKVKPQIVTDGEKVWIEPAEDGMAIDFNTKDWTFNEEDGHFYYNSELATGGVTESLFTEVTFDAEDVNNRWQNGKLVISVTAEAVQLANNPAPGNFADCGHEPEGESRGDEPDFDEGTNPPPTPAPGEVIKPPPGEGEGPGEGEDDKTDEKPNEPTEGQIPGGAGG